jgi:regulator of protease activity HflC (stomatin/prohibitin superfamily)
LIDSPRILREYIRGVIFRLGKLLGTKGPGMTFLIPVVDRMVKMDLRVVTLDVACQEVRLQEIIDRQTDPWGIKVTAVEVRDVVLPDSMKRAMAGQAESERGDEPKS